METSAATATSPRAVLMFSGGRDSTLSAIRLSAAGYRLTLVTITAAHLNGIVSVKRRLAELARLLPASTEWLQVVQPRLANTQRFFHHQTCLPCQSAYVVTGVNIARNAGCSRLAMGYARYQADWPEQAPQATQTLSHVLALHGHELLLPVYDLPSRSAAVQELKTHGVSELSLEQKCSRQVTNVRLDDKTLEDQLGLWGRAIDEELSAAQLNLEVTMKAQLREFA